MAEKSKKFNRSKVGRLSVKAGIGPLSPEEYSIFEKEYDLALSDLHIPPGVAAEKLMLSYVFEEVQNLGSEANRKAQELKRILTITSRNNSLNSSLPSVSPLDGRITSEFGPRLSPFTGEPSMHKGLDIAAPIGTPIYSPADGVVIFVGSKDVYRNLVTIAHGNGVVSSYGHNHKNLVRPGQRVKRSDKIATVGSTGRSTGPHLHYEVLVNGVHLNPKTFILDRF